LLSETDCTEPDHSAIRPVEAYRPCVIRAIETELVIDDFLALETIDGRRVDRDPITAVGPLDPNLKIRDVVEPEHGRRDAKARPAVDTTRPLNDEIDVQDQVVRPVTLVRVAGKKLEGTCLAGSTISNTWSSKKVDPPA